MLYVGVDHHKRYCQVAAMDEQGQIKRNERVPTDQKALLGFLEELGEPCEVALEAGWNWGIIYDWLEGKVAQLHLAHPAKAKAIASAKIKTDTIDACTLAHLLRANLLPTAHIPSKEVRALKNLLRQRIFLVVLRTMVKNRIHALADRYHWPTEGFSDLFGKRGLLWLQQAGAKLPAPDAGLLQQDLELLKELSAHIRATEGWLEEEAFSEPRVFLLESIPGIGRFLALVILAEIDTIERFPTPEKLASYAGLVPSTYASGGRVWHGRITKCGNRYLRWALVEAIWPAIRKSPWLRHYYQRIKERKGTNPAKVATARKLACLVWVVLKEGRTYVEPRPRVALFTS